MGKKIMSRHLTCEETSGWFIGERAPEVQRHIAECARCREEVERIEYAFWQFRDSSARWSEHWYAAGKMRQPRAVWSWRRLAATGGFVSAALVAVLLMLRPPPARHDEEPFLRIPYVVNLAPYEQTTVRRMDVPVTALIAAGFEVHSVDPGGTLTMDVLVGQDGRAFALRPIDRSIKR
jgi:hypothetical protein